MKEEKCDVVGLWEILAKRWSLYILKNLSINGTVRFNQLKRLIPEISSTVLSQRLLELEREGLISKKIKVNNHILITSASRLMLYSC